MISDVTDRDVMRDYAAAVRQQLEAGQLDVRDRDDEGAEKRRETIA